MPLTPKVLTRASDKVRWVTCLIGVAIMASASLFLWFDKLSGGEWSFMMILGAGMFDGNIITTAIRLWKGQKQESE